MGFFRKKQSESHQEHSYPTKDISKQQIRKAIQEYSSRLPDKVPLSVISKDDLSIDYDLLAPILKAKPKQTYYMSKETYEVFEEHEQQLALEVDMVQKAVDNYMKQTDELPVIEADPYKKVSLHKLEKLRLIDYRPNREYYITNEEYLITSQKPD
ncbi:DUF3939 domain-containing protein [Radiobacillus sp. PE A8.2]|uniref:DUF3939 domain-containing protein n=1 Tax=Radiobacillus sp. PE A8.2 TaxID=3380349 RepID=UPI00388E69D1